MEITAKMVKELREASGAGMMDCKKALKETDGDMEKAGEYLRKKGIASASKKEGRTTSQGVVGSYIHMGGKVGVLLELGCEKAETLESPVYKELAKDLTLHVAAAAPEFLNRDEVPAEKVEEEQGIMRAQMKAEDEEKGKSKPEEMIEKILIGKTNKYFSQICFVEQGFVKEDKVSITNFVAEKAKELGDTISIKRYVRYQLGA